MLNDFETKDSLDRENVICIRMNECDLLSFCLKRSSRHWQNQPMHQFQPNL